MLLCPQELFKTVGSYFILEILSICPLRIYTTRYPPISDVVNTNIKSGLQIDQMEFLRRYLKKNFTYIQSWDIGQWGDSESNELQSGISHLGYLTYAPLPDLRYLRRFHLSNHFNVDKYILVVPINYDLIPLWINMLYIFQWNLWVGCILSYALMAMCLWIRVHVYRTLMNENPNMDPGVIRIVKNFSVGKILLSLFQANLGKFVKFTMPLKCYLIKLTFWWVNH